MTPGILRLGALITLALATLARTSWAACPDFASAVKYGAGAQPREAALGDFNGDG